FRDQQQGGGYPSYDDQAAVPAPAPAPGPYGGAEWIRFRLGCCWRCQVEPVERSVVRRGWR
ncbi:hypothetical protein ACN6LI_002228, partial [Streptomyces violaceoruber]